MQHNPILVALDFDDQQQALALVKQLDPALCRLKVGKEMFTLFGPQFVTELHNLGFEVFLDLKFHDIPNTVAKAVRAAAELGVWMVNVHTSGGLKMMQAAKDALVPYGDKAPLLIGVTVLTSMDQEQLNGIGIEGEPADQVLRLAKLAKSAGLNGVVCSAQEAQALKAELGSDFQLVTPGIRPVGADAGDQSRIMTPSKAIEVGADHLVIGRPITKADNPLQALADIHASIND
ncbi:orotidine-5'-phosphate decarboxylase [Paraferrimonas sedimenticola]|uniref:Orotidine 5'-phosphate decarboxylase n=1 Tax=Paraferrimonas sedimenticola TaxID=375674 RepID=A0AA37W183_9GAMM|nr:orotidine-5'-phosphate decarboxylase [Paraferrimonas sedimenticola]GLP96613.1 orotidine 5'-phosphate decarboxylase [Paraferrimonas sedimenticola]